MTTLLFPLKLYNFFPQRNSAYFLQQGQSVNRVPDNFELTQSELLGAAMGVCHVQQYRLLPLSEKWYLSWDEQTIEFNGTSFPASLIGLDDLMANVWEWIPEGLEDFPVEILEDTKRFLSTAELYGNRALTENKIAVQDEVYGHTMAGLMCMFFPKVAYYRCPAGDYDYYVLVRNLPDSLFEPALSTELIEAIQYMITAHGGRHLMMIAPLVYQWATGYQFVENALLVDTKDGSVEIQFSEQGNIVSIQTELR